MKNGDFPQFLVCLPEGRWGTKHQEWAGNQRKLTNIQDSIKIEMEAYGGLNQQSYGEQNPAIVLADIYWDMMGYVTDNMITGCA